MAFVLSLLGYAVALAAVGFVIFSLANGLLWIAELIEEHSRTAKLVGMRAIYSVMAIHVILWATERLPLHLIAISILCHFVYLQNFSSSWPMISLLSPAFLLSCVAVLLDHFMWFFHFAHRTQQARLMARNRNFHSPDDHLQRAYTFWETTTFFTLCVWFIPVFLFLSLSANDNALPTAGRDESMQAPHGARSPRTPLLRSALSWLPGSVLPRRFRDQEGSLIASSHSPHSNPANFAVPSTPGWSDLGGSPFPSPALDSIRRSSSSERLSLQPPPRRTVSVPTVGLGLSPPDSVVASGLSPRRRIGSERSSTLEH